MLDLEVDPPLGRDELDLGDVPGGLQAKRGSEQGFDLVAHGVRGRGQKPAVTPPTVTYVEKSISTGNGIEPVCRGASSRLKGGNLFRLLRLRRFR